jgi:hypothetical protein
MITYAQAAAFLQLVLPAASAAPQITEFNFDTQIATLGLSWDTLFEETSGGPWFIPFLWNADTADDHAYFSVTVDGVEIYDSYALSQYFTRADPCIGSRYNVIDSKLYSFENSLPFVLARTSFTIKARCNTSQHVTCRCVWLRYSVT